MHFKYTIMLWLDLWDERKDDGEDDHDAEAHRYTENREGEHFFPSTSTIWSA